MRLLIMGGIDAGISAGLRARELDPTAEVTLLVMNMSSNRPSSPSGPATKWR